MEMRLLLCGGLVFAVFTAFHVLGEDTTATICGGFIYKGPCNDTIVRYYYSNRTNQCYPFVYGGCNGNGNNYPTCEQCMKNCSRPPRRIRRVCSQAG
ncbi:mambaquaretin-2-like isoform X1 [Dermacentor variabilis]|uniref:mambaquaretin-2-like isoform X1 n=1 Tax=Dermacentor variabilis TaxID=34621 RepID=UPI003F5C2834